MSKPIEAVKQSIRDAISDDPQPDWKDSLSDGLDVIEAIEAERDDLRALLVDIMKFQVKNDWLHLPIWVRATETIKRTGGE